jgi:hypothetical protein
MFAHPASLLAQLVLMVIHVPDVQIILSFTKTNVLPLVTQGLTQIMQIVHAQHVILDAPHAKMEL